MVTDKGDGATYMSDKGAGGHPTMVTDKSDGTTNVSDKGKGKVADQGKGKRQGWPLGALCREYTEVLSSTMAWTPLWAAVMALLRASVQRAATENAWSAERLPQALPNSFTRACPEDHMCRPPEEELGNSRMSKTWKTGAIVLSVCDDLGNGGLGEVALIGDAALFPGRAMLLVADGAHRAKGQVTVQDTREAVIERRKVQLQSFGAVSVESVFALHAMKEDAELRFCYDFMQRVCPSLIEDRKLIVRTALRQVLPASANVPVKKAHEAKLHSKETVLGDNLPRPRLPKSLRQLYGNSADAESRTMAFFHRVNEVDTYLNELECQDCSYCHEGWFGTKRQKSTDAWEV
eukprot:s3509_g1.t1